VMLGEELSVDPKPEQISEYEITPQENISAHLIERKIPIVESQEVLLPMEYLNKKFAGLTHKASVQFLSSFFPVDFDANISQLPDLLKPNAKTIISCYEYLRNTNYPEVLKQLAEVRRQMNLNDWDYYCLINEFSKYVIDKSNAQKVITWFLMLESNYKVKIGYFKDDAIVLIGTAQTLYNTPWFNINGERFYAMQCTGNREIAFCEKC